MNTPPVSISQLYSSASKTRRGLAASAIRNGLVLTGVACIAVIFTGCGSSGSGPGIHAGARFASPDEADLATTIETMEEGEELSLTMAQQTFQVTGEERSASFDHPAGVFTLRMEEGGRSVTIEAAGSAFTWEPGSVLAGEGRLTGFDVAGDLGLTELNLDSRYYEYVHFGVWEVVTYNEQLEHERTHGGAFRQGFETDPANMPTTGTAHYQGASIGKVMHAGEPGMDLHGTLSLHADFASLQVHGEINHEGNFNNIQLDFGTIHDGNRFSGDAVAVSWSGIGSFSEGTTGNYEGAFYGVSAEEVGGTWRLQDGDSIAVGAFGGRNGE